VDGTLNKKPADFKCTIGTEWLRSRSAGWTARSEVNVTALLVVRDIQTLGLFIRTDT
jgi:hypothetical protein